MNITEDNNFNKLLEHSLQQYREMLDMLKSMTQHIEVQSLPHIEKFNTCFHELQQASQQTDTLLQDQVMVKGVPEHLQKHIDHRKVLQQEIVALLQETLPKAKSIKSLMASEMQTLIKGRTALSGYKVQGKRQGRIVNKIS